MDTGSLIPKPRSLYLKVKCGKCGNEQIVFDCAATPVKCTVCEEVLATPTGGKALIKGEVIQELG